MALNYINPGAIDPARLAEALDKPGAERLLGGLAAIKSRLDGRPVWNINSTARGGGVAEILASLIPYVRGGGIDSRWAVIDGDQEFFTVTKRLHNRLHNSRGDDGELGGDEHHIYRRTCQANAIELCARIQPGDVVILHDPQTAGLAEGLARHGVRVIWRCHIGSDESGPDYQEAWQFLAPYLASVDAFVFSRASYVPEFLRDRHVHIITPSIDPQATKNQLLSSDKSQAILAAVGLGKATSSLDTSFRRQDGSPGRVEHGAEVISSGPISRLDSLPLIVQISRWDVLKDHLGVMRYFADYFLSENKARLILAGPTVHAVADDPEAAQTLDQVISAFWSLPHSARRYIQLACLPMRDSEENAAIVAALQSAADIVVQKSLAEGFGLTVAEAMWKYKPVVASNLGGMQEQIKDSHSGRLVDPRDGPGFAEALAGLLDNPDPAIGRSAHERVRANYLHDRQIEEEARLIGELLG